VPEGMISMTSERYWDIYSCSWKPCPGRRSGAASSVTGKAGLADEADLALPGGPMPATAPTSPGTAGRGDVAPPEAGGPAEG
jgi:hypothetical protein